MSEDPFRSPPSWEHVVSVRFLAAGLLAASARTLLASPPPEDRLSLAYYTACADVRAGKDLKVVRDALWRAIIAHPDSYCLRYARQLDEDLAEAIEHPPRADAPPARRLALTRFPFVFRLSLD